VSNERDEDRCWRTIGVWGTQFPRCERLAEVTHCRNCEVFHGAGLEMSSRPIPADYRREWTERLAAARAVEIDRPLSSLVFRIGSERLGLPVAILQEVLEMVPIRHLPHRRSSIVRGLVANRGRLVVCVSLGRLLGISDLDADQEENSRSPRRLLVVGREAAPLAFPVTEVIGIVRYAHGDLAAPVTVADEEQTSFVSGILDHNGASVGCLDGESIILALERSMSK
jgi:chemotaxis-related protein WspD